MKKRMMLILCLMLAVCLSGCLGTGELEAPKADLEGNAWDDSWTQMGSFLGIEYPGNGMMLLDSNGTLSGMEMYYATWAAGDPITVTDDEGEEADLYPIHLYMLVQPCESAAEAQQIMAEWSEVDGRLTVTGQSSLTAGPVEFTLFSYDCRETSDAFTNGVTALGVYGDQAILVDLACGQGAQPDLDTMMEQFLAGFHYAPAEN